jgi:hypothetical protein
MCNIEIILTSEDPVNLVYNFVVLGIIAEFDDFVYSSLRNESMKLLIEPELTEKVLIIKHTTSKKCLDNELSTEVDESGDVRPLKIKFGSRDCLNKVLYSQYKCLRAFYVSVYFYFMPFFCIIFSCLIPII